ncbi:hypothetical protein GCM10023224_31360 [Streptomonospora halophila]|uniref:Uncharacterized protein n=1 Tax=Streptomonospora halophila TaxID=427369 RepID=A0ABP9GJM2_9ACTN
MFRPNLIETGDVDRQLVQRLAQGNIGDHGMRRAFGDAVRRQAQDDVRPFFRPGGFSTRVQGPGGTWGAKVRVNPSGTYRLGDHPAPPPASSDSRAPRADRASRPRVTSAAGAAVSRGAGGSHGGSKSFSLGILITPFYIAPAEVGSFGWRGTFRATFSYRARSTGHSTSTSSGSSTIVEVKGEPHVYGADLDMDIELVPPRQPGHDAPDPITDRSRLHVDLSVPGGIARNEHEAPQEITLRDPLMRNRFGGRTGGRFPGPGSRRIGQSHPIDAGEVVRVPQPGERDQDAKVRLADFVFDTLMAEDYPRRITRSVPKLDERLTRLREEYRQTIRTMFSPENLPETLSAMTNDALRPVFKDAKGKPRAVEIRSFPTRYRLLPSPPKLNDISTMTGSAKSAATTKSQTSTAKVSVGSGLDITPSLTDIVAGRIAPLYADVTGGRSWTAGGGKATTGSVTPMFWGAPGTGAYDVERNFHLRFYEDGADHLFTGSTVELLTFEDAKLIAQSSTDQQGLRTRPGDGRATTVEPGRRPPFANLALDQPTNLSWTMPVSFAWSGGEVFHPTPTPRPAGTAAPTPEELEMLGRTVTDWITQNLLNEISRHRPGLVVTDLSRSRGDFAARPGNQDKGYRELSPREKPPLRRSFDVALENTLKVAREISDATLKGGHVDLPHDGLPVVLRDTAIEHPSTVAVRLFATFGPLQHAGTTERSTGVEVSGGSQSNTSKGSSWNWSLGARMFGNVRAGEPDARGTRTPGGVFPQIRTSLSRTIGGSQGQSGDATYTATLMFDGASDLWESDAIFRANFYEDDDIGQSRDTAPVGSRGTPFRQFVPAQFELATPRLPTAITLDDTAGTGTGRIQDLGQDEARSLVTGRAPRTEGDGRRGPGQGTGRGGRRRIDPPAGEVPAAGGGRRRQPPAIELPSRGGQRDRPQATGQPVDRDGRRDRQPSVHERLRRAGAFVVDVELDYTLGTGDNARDIHLIDAAGRLFSRDVAGRHFFGTHEGYSRKIDHHSSASEGGRLFYPASLSKQNLAPNILFGVTTDVDMSGGFWSPNTLRVAMNTSAHIDSVAFKPVKASVIIEGETPVGLNTGTVRTWTFSVGGSMLPALVTTAPAESPNTPMDSTYNPTFFSGATGDRTWTLSSRTAGAAGSFSVKRSYLIKSGYSYLFAGSGRIQQAVEFRPDWSIGPTKSRTPLYHGWEADKRNLLSGFMHGRDAMASGLLPDLDVVSDGRTRRLSELERQPHPPVRIRPGFHGSGTAYRAPDPTAALDSLSAGLRGNGFEMTANSRDDLRNALQSNLGRRAAAPAPVPVKIRRADHSLLVADLPAIDAVVDISRTWSDRPQAEYTGGEAEFREKFTWSVTRSASASSGRQDTAGVGGFGFMPSLPRSGDDVPAGEAPAGVTPTTLAPAHSHSGSSGRSHTSDTAESQSHTVVLAMPAPYTKLTGETDLHLDLHIETKAAHTDTLQVPAGLRRDGIRVTAPGGTVQELFPAPYLAFGDQTAGPGVEPVRNVPENVAALDRNSPREALRSWNGHHPVPPEGRGALILPTAIENDGKDIRDLAHVVFAHSLGWTPEPRHFDADGDYTAEAVSAARDFTTDKLKLTSRFQGIDQHLGPEALTGLYLGADSPGGTDLLDLGKSTWGLKAEPDLDSGHILDVAPTGTVDGFLTDTEASTETAAHTTSHANAGGPAFGDTSSGTFHPEHIGTQYTSLEYNQGAGEGGPSSVTTAPGAPSHGSRLRQGPLYLVEFDTQWAVAAQSGDSTYRGRTDVRMAAWVPQQDALRLGIIDQAKIDAFGAQRRSLSESQEDLARADDALLKAQHDLTYAANAVAGGTAPEGVGHADKQADLPLKLREYDTRLRSWIEQLNNARRTLFEDSDSESAEGGSSGGSSDESGSASGSEGSESGSESAEDSSSGDSSADSDSDSESGGRRTPDPATGSGRPSTESGPVRAHGTGGESGRARQSGSTGGRGRSTGAGTGRAPEPGTGRAPGDRRFPHPEAEEDPGYESDSEDDLYSATPPRRATPGPGQPRVPTTDTPAQQTGTTAPETPGSTRGPEPARPRRVESESEPDSESGGEDVPAPKGREPEAKAKEQAAADERGGDSPSPQDLASVFAAELNPRQDHSGGGTETDGEQTTDRFEADRPTGSPVIPPAPQSTPVSSPEPTPRPETQRQPPADARSDSENTGDSDDDGKTPARTEADHRVTQVTAPEQHATSHQAPTGGRRAEGVNPTAARDERPTELTPIQVTDVRSELKSLSGREGIPDEEVQAAYRKWLKLGRPIPKSTSLAVHVAYLYVTGELPGLRGGALGLEGELHSIGLPLPRGYSFDDFDEVVEAREFSIVLDLGHRGPILEIVSKPFAVVDGDVGRPSAEEVHRAVQDAVSRLTSARDGARLEQIFADDRFYVDPVAGDFPIRKNGDGDADQVYAHYSAGVPLAGMPQFMRYVGESMRTDGANSTARSQLRDGMRLAQGITREAANTHGFSKFERKELEGFLALTYTQFAAIAEQRYDGSGMAKHFAALNSRVDMWDARDSLSPQVQQYLHQSSDNLSTRFAENFRSRRRRDTRPGVALLETRLSGGWTLRNYLDGAFSDHATRRVGQYEAMTIRTTMGMDYNYHHGVPMLDPPGLVVELRAQGESEESPHGLQATAEDIADAVRDSYQVAQSLKRGDGGNLGFTDNGGPDDDPGGGPGGGPGSGPGGGPSGGYGGSAGGNPYSQYPPPSGGGSYGFGPYGGRYVGQDYTYTGHGYNRAPEPSTHRHDPSSYPHSYGHGGGSSSRDHQDDNGAPAPAPATGQSVSSEPPAPRRSDGGEDSADRGRSGSARSDASASPDQRSTAAGDQGDQQRPQKVGPADDLFDTPPLQSPKTPEPADPNDPWGGNPPKTLDVSGLIDPKKNRKHTRTIDDIIADLTYRYGLDDLGNHTAEDAVTQVFLARPHEADPSLQYDDGGDTYEGYGETADPEDAQTPYSQVQYSQYPTTAQYSQYPAGSGAEPAAGSAYGHPAQDRADAPAQHEAEAHARYGTEAPAQAQDEGGEESDAWQLSYDGVEDLVAAAQTDVVDSHRFTEGGSDGSTELLQFENGVSAVFKDTEDATFAVDRADAEQLASLVGRAVGAKVPGVLRIGRYQILMHYLPGTSGFTYLDRPRPMLTDSRSGHILGLLDVLIANGDRNPGNWLDQGDGTVAGIDHGKAWFKYEFTPEDPTDLDGMAFTEIMGPYYDFDRNEWIDNPLTRADARWLRSRLLPLRSEFTNLGRGDWFDEMMARLDMLAGHASGTADLVTGNSR